MKKILVFLTLMLALTSCFNTQADSFYSVNETFVESLDIMDIKAINLEDIFNVNSNDYFVYIYSNTCEYCKLIKNKVMQFAEANIHEMYFLLYTKKIPLKDDVSSTIGINDVNKLVIRGTPTLLVIQKHKISMNISGASAVDLFLTSFE